MKTLCYDIRMSVPLGIRIGIMTLEINGDDVSGTLSVLGHSRTFSGKCDDRNQLEINGSIQSLLKEIHYVATGSYTENELHLDLQANDLHFRIAGTKRKETQPLYET